MLNRNRYAKINVKVLIILIIVTAALGASLFAARQIRRNLLSKMSLNEGNAAYEKKDWVTAYKNFREYLGRNPDDIEVLRKYAKSRMSVRPIEGLNIMQAIAGYHIHNFPSQHILLELRRDFFQNPDGKITQHAAFFFGYNLHEDTVVIRFFHHLSDTGLLGFEF